MCVCVRERKIGILSLIHFKITLSLWYQVIYFILFFLHKCIEYKETVRGDIYFDKINDKAVDNLSTEKYRWYL